MSCARPVEAGKRAGGRWMLRHLLPAITLGGLAMAAGANARCDSDAQADADTLQLQRQLDREKLVMLTPNQVYCIGSRLRVPSEGGLIGDGTATLHYVGRRARDARDALASANPARRYGDGTVVIDASGDTRWPFVASRSIVLRGFRIDASQARLPYLDAIVARNADDLTVANVEILGMPMGTGIKVASLGPGGRIEGNHVHDGYSDEDFRLAGPGVLPQLTGIEVDNDLVNGRATGSLAIVNNRIERLRIGPAFEAAHGLQTDGINVAHEASHDIHVAGNVISDVLEGIDFFGQASTIEHNSIDDAGLFGIKLIHGARGNDVSDNTLRRSGLAGIVLSGSSTASAATSGNNVSRNLILGIDEAGRFADNDSACILLTDNGPPVRLVEDNRFVRNTLDPGRRGKWLVNGANSRGAGNRFIDNTLTKPGLSGAMIGVDDFGAAPAVKSRVPGGTPAAVPLPHER